MRKLGSTTSYFTPDVGEVPEDEVVHCGVCGDAMTVERNCFGPRSYSGAMGGSRSAYDEFTCPNRGVSWHWQIVALRRAMAKTPSAKITEMLREEIEEVLQTRKPTKEIHCLHGL